MSGDQANCNMGAQPPKEVQWLTNYFTSLYRKEIMEKPKQFERHMNMIEHLEAVDKYLDNIKVVDDLGKVCFLFDSLSQTIKNELLFDADYETNVNNYACHQTTLKKLFPTKENDLINLTELFDLK